ncbi:MAG: GGDEF domain-containing protein, partial [bacterium]
MSFYGALVWMFFDIKAGHIYSSPVTQWWNTCVRLGYFSLLTFLLGELKNKFEAEAKWADTDFLTGALNSRGFYEIAESEINRTRRYLRAFTLAYI